MKKKAIAMILCMVMVFSATAPGACAIDTEGIKTSLTHVLLRTLGGAMETVVGLLNSVMKENDKFVSEEEYSYEGFYSGSGAFIDEVKAGAKWSLGHGEESLVPENWQDYDLYLGGFISEQNFFTNDVREILDDMRVRVIALNDGSGRGTAVFATIDSIGISNSDIRHIRSMLSDFAKENDLNSVNIFATHVHSGIDTQGLWTNIFGKWPANIFSALTGIGKTKQGTDEKYMEFLYEKVAAAIKSAVASMKQGSMTYAEKDITDKYFNNKNRPSADGMDTRLKRLVFTPDDKNVRPTVILNMAAHPDVVGLATEDDPTKGHGLSGDYIYYIGETLNNAGYDFMFFNGAICGIYIGRIDAEAEKRVDIAANYGREIAKMTLGMTMTQEEIESNDYLMSLNFTEEELEGHDYTPWYEDWIPAEEKAVEPILNIALKEVEMPITNPVIKAAGKLGVVNYTVKVKQDGSYFTTTEVGIIEIGKDLTIAMVPGEMCADLIKGGSSLTAAGSITGKAYTGKTLADSFGEDVIVFGLANDAIGYIVPDNDYCMCLDFGHYHESISLGRNTASILMEALSQLAQEVK